MIHWAWIIAGFVFGAWYGMFLVLLTTTKKQKANNSAPSQSGVFESDASCEDNVSPQEEIVNPEIHVLDGTGDERRKMRMKIFKRSIEDYDTIYLCLLGRRYIFHEGKYVGWYKP